MLPFPARPPHSEHIFKISIERRVSETRSDRLNLVTVFMGSKKLHREVDGGAGERGGVEASP